jgi:serine/threonine protein kinase
MKPPAPTAKAVFDRAHEIDSPDERRAYLDQACAGAPEVRREVEALLRAHDAAPGSFLNDSPRPPDATGPYAPAGDTPGESSAVEPETLDTLPPAHHPPRTEGPGTEIGPYRLVRLLGEGGMGAVYLAEQQRPIRRQVALKIIKPGMDSAQVVARFEAERQALTMMDHPHIAKVLDAGATANGRPFFVMELVQGVPMARYCNQHQLTVRRRLELFVLVCQAVQHAHLKGIIHRDLKPSNVLVALQDGRPVPRVIDFGVAKAVEQPLTDQSQLTQAGALVGTLKYMSPEQADFGAGGIDTRSDVYSLGVMLYELLTGSVPLDVRGAHGAGVIEAVMRIKEEEPPRPSARVAELDDRLARVAAERGTEPGKLARLLRRELDWIVLTALEKDRDRRYETASDFAQDVQRYLDDAPVEACPPSRRYQLGKFYRKNRTLLLTAGGFVAVLVLGVVGLAVGYARESRLRQQAVTAEKQAEDAETVMGEGYDLADTTIEAAITTGTTLKDAEKKALRKALQHVRLSEPGSTEKTRAGAAQRQFLVANVRLLIEDHRQAEAYYGGAIRLYEELAHDFPENPKYSYELARSIIHRAITLNGLEKRAEAKAAYQGAFDLLVRLVADFPDQSAQWRDLADTQNNCGVLFRERQNLAVAEVAFRAAISVREKVIAVAPDLPQDQIDLAASCHNLGNVTRDQGDAKAALAWYGKAIDLLTPINPRPDDAAMFLRNAHWDRANALSQLHQHAEAIKAWRQALDLDAGPDRDHLRFFLTAEETEVKLKAPGKPNGELLYGAAVQNARAAQAAHEAEETALEKRYVGRSLELLKQAAAAGWFRDPQRLKKLLENNAFAALPPADFKALLERLQATRGTNEGGEKK